MNFAEGPFAEGPPVRPSSGPSRAPSSGTSGTPPEGPLRAARLARGWSQSRAANELLALARRRGVPVAAPHSLKTQLSRWENHHAVPDAHYRALLVELYGSSEAELGLSAAPTEASRQVDEREALRAELAAAAAMDEAARELFRAQLSACRALDQRLGAMASAETARALLTQLKRAMRHALSPESRRELAWLVADAASLVGRLALDQARHREAWRRYELAKAAALEADPPSATPLLSYLLVEQSFVLLEIGRPQLALALLDQARASLPRAAPGHVWSRLEAARGEALSANGSVQEALLAYQLAEARLRERRSEQVADVRSPIVEFDLGDLYRHRGRGHRLLDQRDAAIADLEQALRWLDSADGGSARDVGAVHLDLAYAHRAAGNEEAATRHARSARDIAVRIGSVHLSNQLSAGHPAEQTAEAPAELAAPPREAAIRS